MAHRAAHPTNPALFQAGLNLIQQALSIYDRDLRLAVCNARFGTLFDLPEALTQPGASFRDTIRYIASTGDYGEIDDIDAFVEARIAQARTFQPHYMERTRANGRTISVEGAPLPEGGWITVYTDITDTRRSEALLRARSEELSARLSVHTEALAAKNRELASTVTHLEETRRQLIQSEAQLRLTTEMTPAHIAHVAGDGTYLYSNHRLSALMPGRPDAPEGFNIRDVVGDAVYAKIAPAFQAACAGNADVLEFTDPESARRMRTAMTPDGDGGVYLLTTDITIETQTRVALQQTRRREMAAQFASGMTHDFANLLTVILAMQGKLERLDMPDEAAPLISATLAAAQRGGRLLNRIASMTSGAPRLRATDLSTLLRDIRTLAQPTLPVGIGFSLLDHLPAGDVIVDAGALQDGLLNLILNARDACGQSGQITLSARAVGRDWIELSVSDTGGGFSQAALDHALEPFFSTKGDQGSGLGLVMVYDKVKMGGGDLEIANTEVGAQVTMRLPYRPADKAVAGGLVLLVEDSAPLREAAREHLTALGQSVVEAGDHDEALELARALSPALVLSDIVLGGDKTGLDLAQALPADMPCVLMTSLPLSDPRHDEARMHYRVLAKPIALEDLRALIESPAS